MDEAAEDSAETRDLLRRAGDGDRQACARLLDRHRPDLRAFIERRLDPRLTARLDASDVVQDAQLEALRRLPDYLRRRPMPFRRWLRKTAYERLLMLRRRHLRAAGRAVGREAAWPDPSSLALAGRLFAPGSTPSRRLARDELARRVRAALDRLAEGDRDVLLMRHYDGMSNEEVADVMGVEPAAARKRYSRALMRLHGMLSDGDPQEFQP